MKEKIKDFLKYHTWLILIIIVIISTSWYYLINLKTEYKKDEQFSLFVLSQGFKNEELLYSFEEKIKTYNINLFNVYNYKDDDSNLDSYYERFGKTSDLLIFPKQDLIDLKDAIKDNFYVFDNFYQEDLSYYSFENKNYALKLFEQDNTTYNNKLNINNIFSFQKDSYLLINKHSYQIENNFELTKNIINLFIKEVVINA